MMSQSQKHEHESNEYEYIRNLKPHVQSPVEDGERVPDVSAMFAQFNWRFFDGRLTGVVAGWSSQLISSGGTCIFEEGGVSCTIKLNEQLLAWRPRKDLVETLLHEMIHAYLFVVNKDRNRQEHASAFCRQMARINKMAGTSVRAHHDVLEAVDPWRRHWWRCGGPCQKWAPLYGVVTRRRGCPPGPGDIWWRRHQQLCGGSFTKVHGPRRARSYSSPTDISVRFSKSDTHKISSDTHLEERVLPPKELLDTNDDLRAQLVKCPFCDQETAVSEIDLHYDSCLISDDSGFATTPEAEGEIDGCPMCGAPVDKAALGRHLDACVPCISKAEADYVQDSDSDYDEDSLSASSDELVLCTLCMNFVREDMMAFHSDECIPEGGEVETIL